MSSKVAKLVKRPILSMMKMLSLFHPAGALRRPARAKVLAATRPHRIEKSWA
jgi:hypothetical protein